MRAMLIVRPGALGDTLLMLPVLRALKARYAPLQITFVGNRAVLPLLLVSGLVDVAEDYESVAWSRLFIPASQQRDTSFQHMLQRFDSALCWLRDEQGLVRQNLEAAAIPLIHIAPGRPATGERMHIEDYLLLTSGLAADEVSAWQMPAALAWQAGSDSDRDEARALVIHPGSGGRQKCWPVEHFVRVITQLSESGIPIVLLSGPAEEERLQLLRSQLEEHGLLERLMFWHARPLLEVAQLLRTCRGYLGNDSGITHLAALAGVPTVALFGPSDPAIWYPIGSRVQVVHREPLAAITPEQVLRLLP